MRASLPQRAVLCAPMYVGVLQDKYPTRVIIADQWADLGRYYVLRRDRSAFLQVFSDGTVCMTNAATKHFEKVGKVRPIL